MYLKITYMALFAAACLGLATESVHCDQSKHYTPGELAVIDMFSESPLGNVGNVDTDLSILPHRSMLPYSVKVNFIDDPNNGPQFWSLRAPLPAPPDGYDTLSYELFVDSAKSASKLAIYLAEGDENRWVASDLQLADLPVGQWQHIVVSRAQMRQWVLDPDLPPDWGGVRSVAIEATSGPSVFHIANVLMTGPNMQPMSIIDEKDDGYIYTKKALPMARPIAEGSVMLALSLGDLRNGLAPLGLQSAIGGGLFAVPTSGNLNDLTAMRGPLDAKGIAIPMYDQVGHAYTKYLTKRQAYDVSANNLIDDNISPISPFGRDFSHDFAFAHPAFKEAARKSIDKLVAAGVPNYLWIDYVYPWADTRRFGYACAMQRAYQQDLEGADNGIVWIDKTVSKKILFPDYFRYYMGFYPSPKNVGLNSWSSFIAPQPENAGPTTALRGRWSLFDYLRAYEWIKFADEAGRYYRSRGGQGLWIFSNGESPWFTPDYVGLIRSKGVTNLFAEEFGNAGWLTNATYLSGAYLREQADRAGHRMSLCSETGIDGHGSPYIDWHVGFDSTFGITAAMRCNNYDDDFLDEAPYSQMSDPAKNSDQFVRFRDGVAKAKGFQIARAIGAQVTPPPIMVITDRMGRDHGSIFYWIDQEYSPNGALSRDNLPFGERDNTDLETTMPASAKMLVYTPQMPSVGDADALEAWLRAGSGKLLLTHSFVPSRDSRGYWGSDHSADLGTAQWGAKIGLGRISATNVTRCTITSVAGSWNEAFTVGESIDLSSPLTRTSTGTPVVMTDHGPLVTIANLGSNRVVYLNYSALDPSNPHVNSLNDAAIKVAAKLVGITPVFVGDLSTTTEVYKVRGGKAVLIWDKAKVDSWRWLAPGYQRFPFDDPGFARTISVTVSDNEPLIVYDFWSDKMITVTPSHSAISLRITGSTNAFYLVGPNTPDFQKTLAKVKAMNSSMKSMKFYDVP